MEEKHRKVLQKLRLHISRNMNVRRMIEVLYSRGILDVNDKESIMAESTIEYKALYLLDLLPRKGPTAFDDFLQALQDCGNAFLVNSIQSELSLSGEHSGERNEWRPISVGLPRKVHKFVGRMDVCEDIAGLFTTEGDDFTCLVTIVAPPGFGKTAVATNIGHMMLDQGKDVLYFSLRSMSSLTVAAKHMLQEAVGIRVEEDPIGQLTRYLTSLQGQTVLILDKAEDLQIGDESKFDEFLEKIGQHAKNLVTLITSRNSVSKLDLFPFVTKHIPLKPLTDEDSLAYLKNHVLGISNQRASQFAAACRGVPLVLKITSSFLRNKAVDPIELHRKLQNCPHSFLKAKDAKVKELCSLLRVFYNNLGPDMKEALAYLASFPTSFTKEEAKYVLFPDEDDLNFQFLLSNLEQHSLVQQDDDNNRLYYSLHPLVQAFCKSSRDDTCTGYNTAIRRFSQHYLSLLQQLNDDFISTNCKIVIDKYHIHKTNICHALLASTELDDPLKCHGLSVSTEAVNFLANVLNMDEFMPLYSQCLRAADTLTDKTLYSECLVSIGFKQLCYYGYKDAYKTDAKRSLQEAHELQKDLVSSDTECLGHCKCKLGLCSFISGDQKKGISLIAQGIGLRKRRVRTAGSGNRERVLLAGGFCDLAMAMFTSEKYQAAVNIWQNICLVRYRELLGTHPFTASLLHYIGDAYQKLGDPRRAVAFKTESLVMRKFLLGETPHNWFQGELLGAGAFGKVYKCFPRQHEIGTVWAVKIVKIEPRYAEDQKEVKALKNEIVILRDIKHERIVSYRGSEQTDSHLHLFMDFVTGGSLSEHIKRNTTISESESRKYTRQMLEGVSFLHSKNIIHRDIKGSNVLLDGYGNVKLADFGLSKIIQKIGSKTDLVSHCGTPYWMAPERILGEGYGRKADVWSVGCTVVEMLTGSPVLGHLEPLAAIFKIGSGSIPAELTLPEGVSDDAKEFILAALTRKPEERPWSVELQKHNFVLTDIAEDVDREQSAYAARRRVHRARRSRRF